MSYIRKVYGVPAYRGKRVLYTGGPVARWGTIKSASGSYLSILLDGDKHPGRFHPTWELKYL